jgi:hypothetical protein
MKKMTIIVMMLVMCSLLAFSKDKNKEEKTEKKKTETVEITVVNKTDKDSEKFKNDMRDSVLEFMGDMKVNPDSCYVPFKK